MWSNECWVGGEGHFPQFPVSTLVHRVEEAFALCAAGLVCSLLSVRSPFHKAPVSPFHQPASVYLSGSSVLEYIDRCLPVKTDESITSSRSLINMLDGSGKSRTEKPPWRCGGTKEDYIVQGTLSIPCSWSTAWRIEELSNNQMTSKKEKKGKEEKEEREKQPNIWMKRSKTKKKNVCSKR